MFFGKQRFGEKRIAYVQYTSPAGFTVLRSGAGELQSKGWTTMFLGVRAQGNADAMQFNEKPGLTTQVLSAPPRGALLKLHYLWFSMWALVKIALFRPKIVYGSEPLSALPLCGAKFLLGISTIYHEHDPPENGGAHSRYIGLLRRLAVSASDICIVPGAERVTSFREVFPQKTVMNIWNGVDREEVYSETRSTPNEHLVLWYQGAIVHSQLPLAILDAMAEFAQTRLIFAGPSPVGQGEYIEVFLKRATELGLNGRVQYLGVIGDRRVLSCWARKADVGLCLFATPFRAPMVGASQKPFEYLASGLPLLVPNTTDWREFVELNDVGVTCDTRNFSDLADVLRRLENDRDGRARMQANGIRKVKACWSYQQLFAPVVSWIEGKVAAS